jgi:ferritin-like metal-binding protein YciE
MEQPSPASDLYASALRNAYEMELQGVAILLPQLERIDSHPAFAQKVRQHIGETEEQLNRLEVLLAEAGGQKSDLRDSAPAISDPLADLLEVDDEVLKAALADMVLKRFEIATYLSLIAVAQQAERFDAVSVLRQNLAEEEAMVNWLRENVSVALK